MHVSVFLLCHTVVCQQWSSHIRSGPTTARQIASRPKLLEFQFVTGLAVHGEPGAPLTLKDSPFWTLTPSYSQNIHVHDLVILAPMDRIGNTDGVNLDSCRNAVVENLRINNSDDGVCMKSGLDGFGMNLAIPTENVLVRNITCTAGGRCGFAIGSEMSGGVRNVTWVYCFAVSSVNMHACMRDNLPADQR